MTKTLFNSILENVNEGIESKDAVNKQQLESSSLNAFFANENYTTNELTIFAGDNEVRAVGLYSNIAIDDRLALKVDITTFNASQTAQDTVINSKTNQDDFLAFQDLITTQLNNETAARIAEDEDLWLAINSMSSSGEVVGNKVSVIDINNSTDTIKYPNTKAVWDFVSLYTPLTTFNADQNIQNVSIATNSNGIALLNERINSLQTYLFGAYKKVVGTGTPWPTTLANVDLTNHTINTTGFELLANKFVIKFDNTTGTEDLVNDLYLSFKATHTNSTNTTLTVNVYETDANGTVETLMNSFVETLGANNNTILQFIEAMFLTIPAASIKYYKFKIMASANNTTGSGSVIKMDIQGSTGSMADVNKAYVDAQDALLLDQINIERDERIAADEVLETISFVGKGMYGNVDYNTMITPGLYCKNGGANGPSELNVNTFLQVFCDTTACIQITQIAYPRSVSNKVGARMRVSNNSGATWTDWEAFKGYENIATLKYGDVDYNTIITPGLFGKNGGINGPPGMNVNTFLEVFCDSSACVQITQRAFPRAVSNGVGFRSRTSIDGGLTWTEWEQPADVDKVYVDEQDDILQDQITQEITDRTNADNNLQNQITQNATDIDAIEIVNSNQDISIGLKEDKSNKAIPDGYASLDSTGKVPITQLPSTTIYNETILFNSSVSMAAESTNHTITLTENWTNFNEVEVVIRHEKTVNFSGAIRAIMGVKRISSETLIYWDLQAISIHPFGDNAGWGTKMLMSSNRSQLIFNWNGPGAEPEVIMIKGINRK